MTIETVASRMSYCWKMKGIFHELSRGTGRRDSCELWSPLWKPSSPEEGGEGASPGARGRTSFPRDPRLELMGMAEFILRVLSLLKEGWRGWWEL